MSIFRHKLNILVLGKNGMLGDHVYNSFHTMSLYKDSLFNRIDGLDYPEIDLTDKFSINAFMSGKIHYDWVVNCAAITDTKGIQTNAKVNEKSYEVNSLACKWIAQACKKHNAKLVHISTDYVFSENAQKINNLTQHEGFRIDSDEFPINDYGLHKLIGELFIKNEMNAKDYAIIRVSWLYGAHANKSFIHKFLKNCYLKQKESHGEKIKITMTSNEFSSPTSVENLKTKILNVIDFNLHGIFNGNDVGMYSKNDPVSRFEFAKEILNCFKDEFPDIELVPIEMKIPEFGQMRYPENSYMIASTDDFCYGTQSWKMALYDFCECHHKEIIEWLKQF